MNLFTIFGEVNLVSPLEIGHKTISIGSNQHKKKAQKAPSLNTLRISIVE